MSVTTATAPATTFSPAGARAVATATADVDSTSDARIRPMWRTGALAGVAAAVATTTVAAVALAADVPLEVDGEQIPLLGFAQLTLVSAALGILLAKVVGRWARRPRAAFVVTTVVLTALSIVPDLTIPATAASKAVLIATHLAAAAIVVPAIAGRLPERARQQ